MSESQAVKPVKFDINDPSAVLPDDEIVQNPDGDAFAGAPPVPDGTHIAVLSLSQQGWQKGKTADGVGYAMANIEARVASPGEYFDNFPVFDSASTMVMQSTGISRISGIQKACGEPVPTRTSQNDLIRSFNQLLGGNPRVRITTKWEGYCPDCPGKKEGKTGKVVLRGMKRFPEISAGKFQHVTECPTCGSEVIGKAKITKYERL